MKHLEDTEDEEDRPYLRCEKLDAGKSKQKTFSEDLKTSTKEFANLIGSKLPNGNHKPVLDLDFDCQLIPSSTKGHFHLYINKEVDQIKWEALMMVLRDCGILESGFADGSIRCGQNTVRCPWVNKEQEP